MTSDDRLWFEEQIVEIQKALYNVAYCKAGNSSDAQDAVCDALLFCMAEFPETLRHKLFNSMDYEDM